ncbi:MAG: glycosyltransferase [Proteobacteria bacterium]|jgi:rhamnosyl/mannosyltransferase|nr:glycosyltransferase [Desulfocapsa sp.]MBU3946000.1 glycosyltransferase [Pseudomonadota bacterium]MCG2743079.1 glycosyltransferase [Desulfobacteraceae bacterium]MBU4030149.1 glycosyltransferase [Pseudomonadota bacterium]MBU4043773.1 glycosyltransferase [Pseudomonadota bacterium]
MKIMNILHVYRTYFPDTQGGLEETVRQICLNTAPFGVKHRIFTLSQKPDPAILQFPEAEVYRFPLSFEIASCGFSIAGVIGFKKLVEWADLIHYHFPWPYEDLLHFLCNVQKPTLVSYQSDIIRQQGLLKIYSPLQYLFLSSVTKIITTSPNYLQSSHVLTTLNRDIEIIPNGLDEKGYSSLSFKKREYVRERFSSDYFLFIGVLRYYKGLQYLLDAARDAAFTVLIAGSGPMEQELKDQARRLGLKNVKFLGYVEDDEKIALIQDARAIVFPSCERSEAFGITLLEGAMFAKPLITAEIGTGTTYINRDRETGLVVVPKDPVSLRAAMEILYFNKGFAMRMGVGARKRFELLFTGQEMGRKYVKVYRDLLHRDELV